MRVVVTLSAALAISVAAPAFSSAADHSYRTIAASSDALSLGQCPAINNLGAVASQRLSSTPIPATARTSSFAGRAAR